VLFTIVDLVQNAQTTIAAVASEAFTRLKTPASSETTTNPSA
jgi:hypothetical protein